MSSQNKLYTHSEEDKDKNFDWEKKKSMFAKINHDIHSGQKTQTEFIGP